MKVNDFPVILRPESPAIPVTRPLKVRNSRSFWKPQSTRRRGQFSSFDSQRKMNRPTRNSEDNQCDLRRAGMWSTTRMQSRRPFQPPKSLRRRDLEFPNLMFRRRRWIGRGDKWSESETTCRCSRYGSSGYT